MSSGVRPQFIAFNGSGLSGPVVRSWGLGAATGAALLWSYWPTLVDLWSFWQVDQDYSAGQLAPPVAAYFFWTRRKQIRNLEIRVCWGGAAALIGAQAIRFAGLYYGYASVERYSLVLSVIAACLLLLGPAFVRKFKWVLLFLFLAAPLPGRIHSAVTLPLQHFATSVSVYMLDLAGYWTAREGTTLILGDNTRVAVAESCNGLRMLTAFVFICVTLALAVRRKFWQKAVMVLSSVPIALAANSVRLVVTVILYDASSSRTAERFFHDFAGVVMMPIAVLLVLIELRLLAWFGGATAEEA